MIKHQSFVPIKIKNIKNIKNIKIKKYQNNHSYQFLIIKLIDKILYIYEYICYEMLGYNKNLNIFDFNSKIFVSKRLLKTIIKFKKKILLIEK